MMSVVFFILIYVITCALFSAALPSVRNMWISTSYPGKKELLVQWKIPINQGHTLPVSYFLIQWHPETSPSTSHWSRVDGFITSTVIRGEKGEKTPKQKSFYFLFFTLNSVSCSHFRIKAYCSGIIFFFVKLYHTTSHIIVR